jgi:signal transduction histidine kinase
MKQLFHIYTRINLVATLVIFLLSGVAFYGALQYTLTHEVDEDLLIEQQEIRHYVAQKGELPEETHVKDQDIYFEPVAAAASPVFRTFSRDGRKYRQYTFYTQVQGRVYRATVVKSFEWIETIARAVLFISLVTILVILLTTFLVNRSVIRRLWQPFYRSLQVMQGFRLGRDQLRFAPTDIAEFAFMNQTLEAATGKALQDFEALKQFTENASHELQTPLAIVRSKLDVLMQGAELSEQQSQVLQSASEAVQRLARLNQSLLLLAKIENRQFHAETAVELAERLQSKAMQFGELWKARGLRPEIRLEETVVQVNNELLEMILNNLLGNATRYTPEGGCIRIELQQRTLQICNAGEATLDTAHLFRRFYRPGAQGSGNGLGLAIVQQACVASGIELQYQFRESLHCFTLHFPV